MPKFARSRSGSSVSSQLIDRPREGPVAHQFQAGVTVGSELVLRVLAGDFQEEAQVAPVVVHQGQLQTVVTVAAQDALAVAVVEQVLNLVQIPVQQTAQAVAVPGGHHHQILIGRPGILDLDHAAAAGGDASARPRPT